MHLAGERERVNLSAGEIGRGDGGGDGLARGTPPIVGVLLGPADMIRANCGVLRGRRGDDPACAIHQHRPRAPGADIDAKQHACPPYFRIDECSWFWGRRFGARRKCD